MQNFMNDFNIFFNSFLNGVKSIFNWLLSTTIGEIFLFIIIIFIFIFILGLITKFKDNQ